MKLTQYVTAILSITVLTGLCMNAPAQDKKPAAADEKFLTSWPAFTSAMSAILEAPGFNDKKVNDVFDNKTVTWEGVVKKINLVTNSNDIESIALEMTGGDLRAAIKKMRPTVADSKIHSDSGLLVKPAADERDAWKSVKTGNTVVFSTVLSSEEDPLPPKGVLGVMITQNREDASDVKILTWINTKGAKFIKIK